jgi:hypothetical protein
LGFVTKSLKGKTLNVLNDVMIMVHCSKCGTENMDDAKFCVKCGTALAGERERHESACFGAEREDNDCFGVRHGSALVGIIVGIFIIVIGLSYFLGEDIRGMIGPFIIIVIGLFIVIGAIAGLSRRRRY